jgi:hypothetical protein
MGGIMGSSSWSGRRIAGAAGIGFVVLFVVVIALGFDGPAFDDPAADVREFFVDSDTQVHLVTWLGALAIVFFFLPFAAGLRNLLAPADSADEQMWARLSYTGAVLTAAIVVIGSAFWEVLSQGVAEEVSDATLVALARFDTVFFGALLPWAVALFLAASSVVILRSGVLAKWIGWFGAAGALLSVIGALWLLGEDDESFLGFLAFAGFLIFPLWVLMVGIVMIRSDEQVAAPGG